VNSFSVPSDINIISRQATFDWQSDLDLNTLPICDNVTVLGHNFMAGLDLERLILPKSVTRIGHNFLNSSHVSNVILPKTLVSVGDYFLAHCKNITTINLPTSLSFIGDFFLFYCYNLEDVTLPKHLITLGGNFLIRCDKLKSLTIKNNRLNNLPKSFIKTKTTCFCRRCARLGPPLIPNNNPSNLPFLDNLKNISIHIHLTDKDPYAFYTKNDIEKLTETQNRLTFQSNKGNRLFLNNNPISPNDLLDCGYFVNMTLPFGCDLYITTPPYTKRAQN
jgi:hypothetical protein